MRIKTLRGFKDILPDEIAIWQFIEENAKKIFESYGFCEIRPPILEYTEIFTTGLGSTTDVVEKEMYTFEDRDGSSVTLRPEGTAGIVRSFIENSMHLKSPVNKLYYSGPMFRHERPQKGRYRNFYQIGAELFGSYEPQYDAELIVMIWKLFESIGISTLLNIEISTLGDNNCRPNFKNELVNYFNNVKEKLCDECNRRLNLNPLRILDCKNPDCKVLAKDAPSILDLLCSECNDHFNTVKEYLDQLDIPYQINPYIVRGLDYYTRTVFEITTDKLGTQNAVAAGGRYDGLVKQLGGPEQPAVGFAMGIERIVLLLKDSKSDKIEKSADLYIAYFDENHSRFAFETANKLRNKGIVVDIDYNNKSLRSKLKRANKLSSKYTLIIGEEELERGKIKIRDMNLGSEEEIGFKDIEKIAEKILN